MKVTLLSSAGWQLKVSPAPVARAARGAGSRRGRTSAAAAPSITQDVLPPGFLPKGAEITATGQAEPSVPAGERSRRGPLGLTVPLELGVECSEGERVILAVRMPSGALTFAAPVDRTPVSHGTRGRRRAVADTKTGDMQVRFVIQPPRGRARAARRGFVMDAIKWVVVKVGKEVVEAVAGKAIEFLAQKAEAAWWANQQRKEGLYRVRAEGGQLTLTPVNVGDVAGPALLLLHGTFSHSRSAFSELVNAPGDFFAEATRIYGDRIFAWDHFTVSKSPEQNVRELLEALPDRAGAVEFDVITHSRGGLVLRTLTEMGHLFGKKAARFKLRRAVLVAAPNAGTPLATPGRWEDTLGFVATVLELFEPNPWAMGGAFVAEGLVWLASHIFGDLPGLASMDGRGDTISALQESSTLESGSYAALTSNFHPTEFVLQRLLDVGMDAMFQTANDLVVPAEGSWLADAAGELIRGDSIACFGKGGNLGAEEDVHHLNYFRQSATVDFLKRALGMPVTTPAPAALDPAMVLPTRSMLNIAGRRSLRSFTAQTSAPRNISPSLQLPAKAVQTTFANSPVTVLPATQTAYADRTLHLLIIQAPELVLAPGGSTGGAAGTTSPPTRRPKMIIATYSNARVIEDFPTSSQKVPGEPKKASPLTLQEKLLSPGHRFQIIIGFDETIRRCLEGSVSATTGEVPDLPDESELGDLGECLFHALFVGDVRRLYDAARAEQDGLPLNIVLTCDVPWIAALPWEFAYDPMRRKYLASEDVHFTRGVVAAVPAQVISRQPQKLRLLVVSAQPVDAGQLSIAEERERIEHAFLSLTATGLVEIDILTDASPASLQTYIMGQQFLGRSYEVVHFIGHGEFVPGEEGGKLLLVTPEGYRQELEVRPLREMLSSRGIHLVFLNACESGVGFRPGNKDHRKRSSRGLAQALVEGGLPAVLANQYTVLDTSALAFAECFYRALSLGASLGQAAREARIALNYAVDGDAIDWAVPVLYARDPDIVLCSPDLSTWDIRSERAPSFRTGPAGGGMSRSAGGPTFSGRIRVGIADISSYFPRLAQIILRLNQVQTAFEFVMVKVAIPLGVWEQRDWGAEEGGVIRYLIAGRFAEKLKEHPQRLGVHYLICATNHWMMYNDGSEAIYNVYGWWSSTKDNRVMLFSTGGLTLPREGNEAGLVVTNAICQSLAAQICEEAGGPNPIHSHGAKDCPFFYNEARVEESIAGPNVFEPHCRDYLNKHVPTRLFQIERQEIIEAFDQLLSAFAPAKNGPLELKRSRRMRSRRVM